MVLPARATASGALDRDRRSTYCPPESGSSALGFFLPVFGGAAALAGAPAAGAAAGAGSASGAALLALSAPAPLALSAPLPLASHQGILIVLSSASVLASSTASSPSLGPRNRTSRFLLPATASAPIRCA